MRRPLQAANSRHQLQSRRQQRPSAFSQEGSLWSCLRFDGTVLDPSVSGNPMRQADISENIHTTAVACDSLSCTSLVKLTCSTSFFLLPDPSTPASMTKKHGRDSQPAADQAPAASPSTKKQRLTDIETAAPAAAAAAATADTTPDDLIAVACGDARGCYSSSKGLILVDSSEQQGSWVSRADFVNKLGGRGSHDYLKAIKVVAEDGSSLGQLGKYLKGHSVTPARPSKQQGEEEQTGEEQGGDAFEFPPDGEAVTAAAEGEAGTANGKARGGAKAAAGAQGGTGSRRRSSAAAAAAVPASAQPKSARRGSKTAAAAAAAAEEEQAAAAGSGGSSGAAAGKRGRRSSAAKAPDSEPAEAAAGSGGKGRASAAKGRRSKAAAAAADADTAPAAAAVKEEGGADAASADGVAGDTAAAVAVPSADIEPDTAAAGGSSPSKAQQKKHGRARRQKLSSAATWDGLEGGTSTASAAEAAAAAAAGGEEGPVDGSGAGVVQDEVLAGAEQNQEQQQDQQQEGQGEEAELHASMQGVFPAVQQPEDESLVSLMNGPDVGAGPVGDAVGQGGDGHDQFGAGLQYDWAPGAGEAGDAAAAAGEAGEQQQQQQEDGGEGEATAAAAGEEGGAAVVGGCEATAAAPAATAEDQAKEQGDATAAAAMEVDAPAEPTAAAEPAAVAAGGGSITFAELRVQLLEPAARAGLDQLWGVAQQVYGPSASAAAVRVAPILQIYGDEAILGDSRVCFMAGEESYRQQAVQRLTALQQLLSEPAMGGEGVLQQGQHEVLCAGVDGLLADFAAVGAAAGSG